MLLKHPVASVRDGMTRVLLLILLFHGSGQMTNNTHQGRSVPTQWVVECEGRIKIKLQT